jgi:hypothetical protein
VSAGVVRTFRPGDEAAIRSIMEASLATDAIPGFEAGDIDRASACRPTRRAAWWPPKADGSSATASPVSTT